MESGFVSGFLPSTGGFHFDNSFPAGSTYPVITLPVVGSVVTQDASTGLCGGFVFAALDMFLSTPRLQPPGQTTAPADGSPLFDYLVQRLLDSFGPGMTFANAAKAIEWIQTRDHDVDIPLLDIPMFGRGLAHRMVLDEWPAIKSDIDSGRPAPLYLVMAPQCEPLDIPAIIGALGHSHQVLAYSYTLDDTDDLTLHVYDPNDADDDNSSISLNISHPADTIPITATAIEANLEDPVAIRGFFRSTYDYVAPTALQLSPA
jgi:hypothetical protein